MFLFILLFIGEHWSYPGNITQHLQQHHGQNVAGLTVEQQLNLHDKLHESSSTNSIRVQVKVQSAPRKIIYRFNRRAR